MGTLILLPHLPTDPKPCMTRGHPLTPQALVLEDITQTKHGPTPGFGSNKLLSLCVCVLSCLVVSDSLGPYVL